MQNERFWYCGNQGKSWSHDHGVTVGRALEVVGFWLNPWPFHCHIATLSMSFTHAHIHIHVTLSPSSINYYWPRIGDHLKTAKVTVGLAENYGSLLLRRLSPAGCLPEYCRQALAPAVLGDHGRLSLIPQGFIHIDAVV